MDKETPTFIDATKISLVIEQCREEQTIKQSSRPQQVQEKGILVEGGIRKCTTYQKSEMTEVIGDSQQNICRRREELVLQTINEFSEQLRLDAKFAQTKGMLMEKGIRTYDENQEEYNKRGNIPPDTLVEHIREEYALQLSSVSRQASIKEQLIEKGLRYSWENKVNTLDDSSFDMSELINDINQFTTDLERNSHNINWSEFRGNLLKIHRYYMKQHSVTRSEHQNEEIDIGEVVDQMELDIEHIMEPLNNLIERSKTLSSHIEGVECKINSLDRKVEEFYKKYNQTLINREKAFKDMMTLQSMREKIGQRLSQIELEIHASRTQLMQRGVLNK